jgi:hypothetical protein
MFNQYKSTRRPALMAKGYYMTSPTNENQAQVAAPSDKELNFRALEAKYQRQVEQERAARLEAEKVAHELQAKKHQSHNSDDDDDDDSEPYVDKRRLAKQLNKFGQSTQSEIQKAMEQAKYAAKEELKQEIWLENNPDFYDVLQHAEKFAQKAPELAKTILRMPEGFERQKLVYQNIKELGVHKPEQKTPSIQEKIDSNRRSPYYQPSGVGTSPYNSQSDFSAGGQKQAYDKMQELKARLRL